MNLIDAILSQNIKGLVESATGFRYKPKKGTLEASNNAFRLDDCTAWSYSHWCYYKVIDGKGVFNRYRYSVTTARHQSNMRDLIHTLGLPIDIEVDTRRSISSFDAADIRKVLLENFYAAKTAYSKCKRESRKKDNLQWDMENLARYVETLDGAPFDGGPKQPRIVERDATDWGASDTGVHRLDPSDHELTDAIESADRDGFDTIYVYRTRKPKFSKLKLVGIK
jgi:hypothetical protein